MSRSEKTYISKLQEHVAHTLALLSNAQKPERECMVVRAFLRCVGEQFTDDEILASSNEPVDVAFRSAQFQVKDVLGGRRRGVDWREREHRYGNAKHVSDVLEPWTSSVPMSFDEVSQVISASLAKYATHYGIRNCSTLDALVYIDLSGRHLWPLEPTLNAYASAALTEQGWRSVSMLFVPYGAVLIAQAGAPDLLRDRVGLVLNQWPHCDGWFDL